MTFIEIVDSFLNQILRYVSIALTLPFDENASYSFRKGTNNRPKLYLIFRHKRHRSVFKSYVEGIEPAVVITYYYWRSYYSVLFQWAIIFNFYS